MHLFGDGVQTLGAAVVIIAALASAAAFYRANLAKAQIAALRGDRDDLQERCDRFKEEITEVKADLQAEKTAREVLERAVTGRDLMEELRAELAEHHEAAMHGQRKIHDTLSEAVDVLTEIKNRGAG